MAFVAMRSFVRAAQCPALLQRPASRVAAVALNQRARGYVTAENYSREELLTKLNTFHDEVFTANWGDYLCLVYNVPFWEAENEKLTTLIQPYIHENETGNKFAEVQEMLDVLYKCEDVRDHINELAELATRASGFMGTGYAAEEKVENMQEHAEACAKAYEALLTSHPTFKPKIEQTVGHGLAVLRQKHKFKWSSMHRYFF
eukprot:TRINITY_DN10499_c0_g2_i1.p1 TRINITY_DN10499_c0_g2~~TRINITY_DN10499_c0_g2_i1.p1  ORF type:complete len:202 (-),score=30.06 TRINITY_DN10499_c0_g2_i1:132-737(-)